MIELNYEDIKEMITSRDAESRRLGLTMVAENIYNLPPPLVSSFRSAYDNVIDTRMGITGGLMFNPEGDNYFKTHYLTWGSVNDDARFIIENVTKDESVLRAIFPINLTHILNDYK